MDNIYYVGRRIEILQQRDSSSRSPMIKRQALTPNTQKETSVNSSRKTQPRHGEQRLDTETRHHSLKKYINSIRFTSRIQQSSTNQEGRRIIIKPRQQKQLPSQSSAISMQSLKFKLKFNKVQQFRQPTSSFGALDKKRNTHPKCEKSRTNKPQINFSDQQINQQNQSNNQNSNSQRSECSQLFTMYKLQPRKFLFLCDTCKLFLPFIQIKSHYMQCFPPKSYADYLSRWQRVIQLCQQMYRMQPSSQLFTMISLMEVYPTSRMTRQPAPALYSQELIRILRYGGLLNFQWINKQDLFGVIETVGDRLETLSRKSQPWLLCS